VARIEDVRTLDRRHVPAARWPPLRERRRPLPRGIPHGTRDILLVDDDVGFVETFGALLRQAGYTVMAEFTHAAALEYLSSHTPDVLITDLRLGSADGWSLARYAKEHQPTLPILVVTGWSYVLETEELYGRVPVFLKPFEPETVINYLDSMLLH
jgi:DNA-binding NtrC family response regulator